MCKNKILEKMLAIILIFTLTFANFALVTKSYAASLAEVLFGTNDTGNGKVEFDAYFEAGEEKSTTVISDVNNKELFITMNLNVGDKGYLKDGTIAIVEAEEGKGINFNVREEISQKIEDAETEAISQELNQEVNQEAGNEGEEINSQEVPAEEVLEGDSNQESIEQIGEESVQENVGNLFDEIENEEEQSTENEQTVENLSVNDIQESNEEVVSETNQEIENLGENIENEIVKTEEQESTQISEENVNVENIDTQKQEEIVEQENQEQSENKEIVEEVETTIADIVSAEECIASFEENVFYLNQINGAIDVNLQIPIEYKNEEYVSEEKISTDAKIIFTGTYVNNKGEEEQIIKEIVLNVSWKDNREIEIGEEATKYITYGQGVILQTVERVDNRGEANTLPVKETELEIIVPVLKDKKPSKISVVANKTEGTNGEEIGSVSFTEEDWTYNEEENKLRIKVNNEKQLVEVKENEEEFLQEETEEIVHEERYYNGSGIDEFLVTYTYSDVEVGEEAITVNSNVTAKMTTVSGVESEENINIVTSSKEYNYELRGTTGDIVSLNIESKKEEISKAYGYINYNNPGKYETEIESNMIVNISYKDIVEKVEVTDTENAYVNKDGVTLIPTNDIYYKTISISKENFDKILGENGEIKVKDEAGNVITVINKDTVVNEQGNIVIGFETKYSRLSFETSKPEGEGNLVINTVKVIKDVTVDKPTYMNIDKLISKTNIKAQYDYVEEIVDVATIEKIIKLTDTKTEANLVINKGSLSTLEENKDVEMRIELNNAKDTSDIYGTSEFTIELPENVEAINITNISLLYGEGLSILSHYIEGKTIKVYLEGKQEGINSGVLTNGTNIVINANIKVNLYTPAKTETIKLRYINNEATNYVGEGYKEIEIEYSAPTGLVAVNSITGYNDEGSIVTSVRQGKKEGILGIYGPGRIVTTELIVMNNNGNTVSEMSILGRIPYIGVKDFESKEELGTTIESKIATGIASDGRNRGTFKVYYSENGEATKDLDKVENGWTDAPASMDNIKSYLIVPEDTNYEMEKYEVLRFIYTHTIPENLAHNEYAYGTFCVNYRNNSEVAKTTEREIADIVGLTTGVGPELKLTVTSNKEEVKEYEEFCLTVKVENIGEVRADNVNVKLIDMQKAALSRYEYERNDILVEDKVDIKSYYEPAVQDYIVEEIKYKNFMIPNIEIGQMVEIKTYIKAYQLKAKEDVSGKLEYDDIETQILVNANELGNELSAKNKIKVLPADLSISEYCMDNTVIQRAGNDLKFSIIIDNNNSQQNMTNVIVSKTIPNELSLVSCTEPYEYNENTREINWKIDNIGAGSKKIFEITLKVNELKEDITKTRIETSSTVKADNTDIHTSNSIAIDIAKPILKITQTSSNENTYIKEGENLKYTYLVKNEGEVDAYAVNLSKNVPDGLGITNIKYTVNGMEKTRTGMVKDNITISANIAPGAEMVVDLEAVALSLNGAEEKSVTTYATLTSEETKEIRSNSITHIIEASEKQSGNNKDDDYKRPTGSSNGNIEKTYKITGLAWFDADRNGMRAENEKLFDGITVRLVDSTSGMIQSTVKTDTKGVYTFTGVKNGTYLIIFEYDTQKYTVTTYQKDGVASNINSDAILTTISLDGKTKEGAVTDVIKIQGGSISNIDIGLSLIDTFDLKLDKTITKVVVQTSKETKTEEYENEKLAKAEIGAKNISGATVYVEYAITVKNEGDIAGYAKKIVDYIPEGMIFNSSLDSNADWYTGSDGNLYSEALANKELKTGETATIKLVLMKQMTTENTGLINNQAEIYESYNTYGITDKNSTPGNKIQKENDMSSADMIISVKTGEVFIYVSVIVTTILLGIVVIFIVYSRIIPKRKWVM